MNERYDQPFYVGSSPRFRYAKHGYLPALEPTSSVPPTMNNGKPEPEWSSKQWQYVLQLRAQVNYLNNKVKEMLVFKKPRGEY